MNNNYLFLFVLFLSLAFEYSAKKIATARLESCPGCSLNRLPEVRSFAYDDLPEYGVEFKKIHGAPPELVFLDDNNEELERHPLSKLTRKECNELLERKGITKSQQNQEL